MNSHIAREWQRFRPYSRWAGLFLCACAIHGQMPESPRPGFEAASIHLNRSGDASSSTSWNSGRIAVTNTSLKSLILLAFRLKPYQLAELPSWAEDEKYDIAAKAPSRSSPEDLRRMFLSLLEDRFRLATRREQRQMAVLALIPGPGNTKLTTSAGSPQTSIRKGSISGSMTLATLADSLARVLGSPIFDQTDMKGTFDIKLEWAPEEATGPDATSMQSAQPSLFAALQEQLGLRLERRRAPVDILVIDHIERPTEN